MNVSQNAFKIFFINVKEILEYKFLSTLRGGLRFCILLNPHLFIITILFKIDCLFK